MDRKTVRAILADEALDESAKVGKLLQLHHDELADIKGGLKTDEDVKAAVEEALKSAPKAVKVEESDEYKKLKTEYEDYKYASEVKAQLRGAKVKEKFLDDVVAKIKREEKLDDQLPKIKESFSEYFDGEEPPAAPPANKPIFGSEQKGGGAQKTADEIALQQARESMGLSNK